MSRIVLAASVIVTAALSVAATSAWSGTRCAEWEVSAAPLGGKHVGQPFAVVREGDQSMIYSRVCAP